MDGYRFKVNLNSEMSIRCDHKEIYFTKFIQSLSFQINGEENGILIIRRDKKGENKLPKFYSE